MIYTEYDPLEEVIVADMYDYDSIVHLWPGQDISGLQRIMEETKQDCDALAHVLTSHGVRVHRPDILNFSQAIHLPACDVKMPAPPIVPRDHFKVVDQTVLQTYGSIPERYFDGFSYYAIFRQLFDQGYNWISQPAPLPTGLALDEAWYLNQGRTYHGRLNRQLLWHTATMFVLGDAVIVNDLGPGNLRGLVWIEKNLPNLRVISNQQTESHGFGHIDHGFFMVDDEMVFHDGLHKVPEVLRNKHLVDISELVQKINLTSLLHNFRTYKAQGESAWIQHYLDQWQWYNNNICFDLNILIVDRHNIIFARPLPELFALLKKFQIECHVCPMRHMLYWDSGVHCATLDVKRRGQRRCIV
jgi:glycine amidinotransferase